MNRNKNLNNSRNRNSELAQQLESLDENIQELEANMEQASYDQDHERVLELNRQYEEKKREVEVIFSEWESVSQDLNEMTAEHAQT